MLAFSRLVLTTSLYFPATTAKEPQHVRNRILFCLDCFESSATQDIFCPSSHYSFLYIRQKSLYVCKRALTVCKRTPTCPQEPHHVVSSYKYNCFNVGIFSPCSHYFFVFSCNNRQRTPTCPQQNSVLFGLFWELDNTGHLLSVFSLLISIYPPKVSICLQKSPNSLQKNPNMSAIGRDKMASLRLFTTHFYILATEPYISAKELHMSANCQVSLVCLFLCRFKSGRYLYIINGGFLWRARPRSVIDWCCFFINP